MEIQKINKSPSFQAIQLSSKEYQKANTLIRSFRESGNQTLKEQICDIFTPHIQKEAKLHNGVLEPDFIQEMYLCLLENLEKIKARKNPAEKITNKLNEIELTDDFYTTIGHVKSIENLTEKELESLTYQITPTLKYDAKQVLKSTCLDNNRKTILIEKINNKTDIEIAEILHVTESTAKKWANQALEFLETDRAARKRAGLYIY